MDGLSARNVVRFAGRPDERFRTWLMFRTSGTEPIIRIYSEAASAARVKKLLEYGRQLALKIAEAT
jgi:phosphomannomutase